MAYKLSPSSLSLFQGCPRCFWLDKHKVWKRPSGPFPSLPSGMDRILKVHFDKFRDKGELPPELKNSDCHNCRLFADAEKLKEWRNNLKGVRWQDEDGNILFGAVDNLLVKDGKIIVIDYKTRGYPVKEETSKTYQNQLDIYSYLLRKNGYQTEDFAYLLFYMPKEVTETGEVVFDTTLVKMDVDPGNAEKLFRKALRLLEGECPEETCEWCNKV